MVGIALQPLPSSLYVEETDVDSISGLTDGYEQTRISNVTDPESLIAHIQSCRVAIVGSYHAGVYALAQGVPIVGLYNSDYYRDKFLGLEALFGNGVYSVDLSIPEWNTNLIRHAEKAWATAPSLRMQLITATDKQIESGRTAYSELRSLVNARFGQP